MELHVEISIHEVLTNLHEVEQFAKFNKLFYAKYYTHTFVHTHIIMIMIRIPVKAQPVYWVNT